MSAALRPLPPRPNLEFEHKEAKALLRRLRAGDPEALTRARARHSAIDAFRVKLADAQLVIAREYGFTSWPKLVRYFGETERWNYIASYHRPEHNDMWVRTIIGEHRDRRIWTAHILATFAPRFYGMRPAEVFSQTVSEEDARLATARSRGFPSWAVMLEETADFFTRHPHADKKKPPEGYEHPMRLVSRAMESADVNELQRVAASHPELLSPTRWEDKGGHPLMRTALHHERTLGVDAMRPIIAWLATQGIDLQVELNRQLCSHFHEPGGGVQWLLDRGADPNWVAPNGIPVLEHVLLGFRNRNEVDLIAARAKPRKALWIAAGLGDVPGVGQFLDRDGRPTTAAYKLRPDFMAVGPGGISSHPDPDDEMILFEAFVVALMNHRTAVMEYMVSRGFDVNSLAWGTPIVVMAIGNRWVSVVECLVRCGADLDLRGWRPNNTAREIAAENFLSTPLDPDSKRIAELCGLDPDKLLAANRK